MSKLEQSKLPAHVAIIMDGNGRWAKMRGLPRAEGHIHGLESVRNIVTLTRKLHIPFLTLYAFSKENWTRPRAEVKKLLTLLGSFLESELQLMMDEDIRFRVVGNIMDFPKRLQTQLNAAMQKTSNNSSLSLNIALSYSGREEILNAVREIINDVKMGHITNIDENVFQGYLYTKGMPDPDLLIRTSGEIRVSNFLLWQIAYTEIYVTDTLWPDFREDAYMKALTEYTKRERRFGSVKENSSGRA
ncbi:MAG TPA: isoprenyl transferase [Syntrophorhabdaceae bacterium]|jgi:undecaprenyl diphosphate synthase|nr:isoprenyl transferase [Syntrophorhabdaceae bacterium]MDI9560911.1 isoprenyl transferase [Pseudomonadota bacterium]OQC48732.1 MAG: Ditrans,polycis-undecaprenyl-diphosphate synthase ((2E,6E)-farnesyl-diphosphate specific) [Deltaproteobacteria bacterium ADurb.Bin026]MBP8697815.1 isoprenyl transferase [Syntrophorhabdaceae bacterium]MBV6505786.1 Ditrans,polycis-undecaprenyl-diphosphate synthase ((2E,6E)-farnesyl-diphosphate specific) [Syntrophorhabdaceae bacterium]